MMDKKINILVASKSYENRESILSILSNQNDLKVIGIEKDETGTIIKSERLQPDVLLLDLQSSGLNEAELAPIIHRRSPSTSILMISDKDDNDYAGTVIRAGILGFLLRKTDMDKLTHAIRIVNLGGFYISPSITVRALEKITDGKQRVMDGKNIFSPAERGIMSDLVRGFSDKEIAEHLHFSKGSIRNCITAIKHKTNLKNRIQIAIFFLNNGIINSEQIHVKKTNRQFPDDTIQ